MVRMPVQAPSLTHTQAHLDGRFGSVCISPNGAPTWRPGAPYTCISQPYMYRAINLASMSQHGRFTAPRPEGNRKCRRQAGPAGHMRAIGVLGSNAHTNRVTIPGRDGRRKPVGHIPPLPSLLGAPLAETQRADVSFACSLQEGRSRSPYSLSPITDCVAVRTTSLAPSPPHVPIPSWTPTYR